MQEDDHQPQYEALHQRIAAGGRPLRLLIVDDNPTNRAVAVQMLSEFAIQTNTACDGPEAITAATSFNYDMILMDMRMPEMDGLAATRAIRAKGGALATVPILAFTANAFAEDEAACREAGMNDYIAKPVRKNVLVSTILRALPPLPADAPSNTARTSPLAPAAAPVAPVAPVAPEPRAREAGAAKAAETNGAPARLYVGRKAFAHLVDEIGEEASRDVLAVFIRDTEARMRMFDALQIPADRRTIEREAHALKSAAGTFGLETLARLARDLEQRAPTLSAADYAALAAQIKATFATARRAPIGDDRLVECAA